MATKGHMPFGGAANVRLADPNPTVWEDGGPSVLGTGPMNPYGSAPGNAMPSHEFSRDVQGTHQNITPPGYFHINQNGGGGMKMAQVNPDAISNKLDEIFQGDEWVMMDDAQIGQALVQMGHATPQEAQNLDVGEIVSGLIGGGPQQPAPRQAPMAQPQPEQYGPPPPRNALMRASPAGGRPQQRAPMNALRRR